MSAAASITLFCIHFQPNKGGPNLAFLRPLGGFCYSHGNECIPSSSTFTPYWVFSQPLTLSPLNKPQLLFISGHVGNDGPPRITLSDFDKDRITGILAISEPQPSHLGRATEISGFSRRQTKRSERGNQRRSGGLPFTDEHRCYGGWLRVF